MIVSVLGRDPLVYERREAAGLIGSDRDALLRRGAAAHDPEHAGAAQRQTDRPFHHAGRHRTQLCVFFFSSRRRHTSWNCDWSSDVCSSDLHASAVVVGENFRFGHKAAGDVDLLGRLGRTFGFSAHGVPLVHEGEMPMSATYVRSCVTAGDMTTAAAVLGRPHRIDGVVERGDQRGRELGYPTANLRTDDWVAVPADGVYAGRVVRLDEWGRTVPGRPLGVAAISVGTNPTFDVRQRRVEAYILDFEGDLYGDAIGIEFVTRLRGMEKFESVEDLVVQMNRDVEQTRHLLA